MIQCIDTLDHPPRKGSSYLVACVKIPCVEEVFHDGKFYSIKSEKFVPVIPHLHNDRENGQDYQHYHVDIRFLDYAEDHRINIPVGEQPPKIKYRRMRCKSSVLWNITIPELIANSNLKHKCIHKGKCPHRGYDLTHIIPVNGVITCPLHGLRFSAETGELINDPTNKNK